MAENVTHTLHWVQGNTVNFAIPLQQETQTPQGKIVSEYYPDQDDNVSVFACGKYLSTQLECSVVGNVVTARDNGKLKVGVYGIEVRIAKANGTNLRSMWNYQVEIHKTNDGVLTEWDDFVAPDSQSLESAIFFFAKGEKGDKGDKGDTGANGEKGDKGDDGITPHVDDTTGNWFVGDEDTGVHAQGERGEQGEQGEKGDTGFCFFAIFEVDSNGDLWMTHNPLDEVVLEVEDGYLYQTYNI